MLEGGGGGVGARLGLLKNEWYQSGGKFEDFKKQCEPRLIRAERTRRHC